MGKRKDDKGRSKRRPYKDDSSDSDSVLNDSASVLSGVSYASSNRVEIDDSLLSNNRAEELDDDAIVDVTDDFESKFDLVLDNLQSAKSAKARLLHYESLAKALTTRFCFEYIDARKITIQDIIEHGLRRSDDESGSAALTLSLILISMGTSDFCDEIFRDLFVHLERVFMDTGAKPAVRAKCATALSLGCFITDYGMEKTGQILDNLLSVAFTSVKGHPDANQMNAIYGMKASCLDMFSFLVSIESDDFMMDTLEENIGHLTASLDAPNLAMRVAAGECIALLMEKCRLLDEDYELVQIELISDKLQQLATDSAKSRSKKELREQRSNFRQILHTVEGNEFGEEIVKIGDQERVEIECWQSKRYYDTFCSVLGSGMNLHLAQNILLRDIFELGPVIVDNGPTKRVSKFEKNYLNNFNRKAREINRGKMRGKRADYEM